MSVSECRCEERLKAKAEGSRNHMYLFIVDGYSENYQEDQYMIVGTMKDKN